MLWGLLAASIPIIIHLLNRRRHRTVKWAAMQFLLKATRESRGKKRLRHILILTCRALGIAALVTAAALPVVSSFLGLGAGKPDLIVLVFDRSASMAGNPANGSIPRRELALQRVLSALSELDGSRVVLMDSASGTPQDLPSPGVLAELSATAATDTAADLPSLLNSTAEFLAATPGKAEVWVVSDLQASNWSPDDDRWTSIQAAFSNLTQPPQLRILALGGETAANQSVRILSSRRSGTRLLLDLEITRDGDAKVALSLPVTTQLNGAGTTDPITIDGQQYRFQKALALGSDEESGYGWVSIPGDGNLRDNVAYFAYGPARPLKSVIVGPAGEAADYLTLAAAPDPSGIQSAERINADQFAELDQSGIATVFWSAPLPEGPTATELSRFLESGGHVIFFPPLADSESSFLEITWSPITRAAQDQFFILDSWDRKDGLLRNGIDGTPLAADRLRAIQRRIPLGETSTLGRWDDTEPFLCRQIVGRGTAWFVGSTPDYKWSNLGDADVLLPLVQRAITAGAERFDSGFLAELGSPDDGRDLTEARERLDAYPVNTTAKVEYVAGVYRLGERTVALNRPAEEDLAGILGKESLDRIFEGTKFSLFEDTSGSARESISRGVWRSFLIAMLFFLLAEALLCLPKRQAPSFQATPGAATPSSR